MPSRPMQWSGFTEEKQKNQLENNSNNNTGRQLPVVLRLYISVALQQKTANFKLAIPSRRMQWSPLTEEKQKNQLARTKFRFIKTTIIRGGNYPSSFASTSALHCSKRRQTSRWPSSADQCSGVQLLKKSKRINLLHESDEGQRGWKAITACLAC